MVELDKVGFCLFRYKNTKIESISLIYFKDLRNPSREIINIKTLSASTCKVEWNNGY